MGFTIVESSHKNHIDKSNKLASQNQNSFTARLTDKVLLVSNGDTAQLS